MDGWNDSKSTISSLDFYPFTCPSSSPYWHPEHWKPGTTPELMNQRRRLAVNAIFQHAMDCITHLCLMLLTSSSVQWHRESQLHSRQFSPGIIDIICCSRCFMSFHFSSLTRKLEGLLHCLQRHLFIVRCDDVRKYLQRIHPKFQWPPLWL